METTAFTRCIIIVGEDVADSLVSRETEIADEVDIAGIAEAIKDTVDAEDTVATEVQKVGTEAADEGDLAASVDVATVLLPLLPSRCASARAVLDVGGT
jgi:hypothetical protein